MNNIFLCIKKSRGTFKALLCFCAMLVMMLNPEKIISASCSALKLCIKAIVPSLFPFMTAAYIFTGSVNRNTFLFLAYPLKFLFGISSAGAAALIPGIICGYPVGARCSCSLYENEMISKSEAESLIAFSNNSGPLFIIGAVGTGILHNSRAGVFLYIIHILNAVVCGIILKPFTVCSDITGSKISPKSPCTFTDAVSESTLSVLKICGFVVIFAVINAATEPLIKNLPLYLRCFVSSFLEITNAVDVINSSIHEMPVKLIAISSSLGWSGLSVHMQVKSIVKNSGLSMKKYYIVRAISAVNSAILTYIALKYVSLSDASGNIDFQLILKILTAVCIAAAAASLLSMLFKRQKVIKYNLK